MLYRVRESGMVLTQGQVRGLYPNTSFPAVWDSAVCNLMGIDPILASPKPTPELLETIFSDGVELDTLGNWVEKWSLRPMFSDYTNEEGVVTTAAEAGAAYTAARDATQAKAVRDQRAVLLRDSDWTQVIDAPVDQAVWGVYRQALRDVTAQAGFPWTVEWPTQP